MDKTECITRAERARQEQRACNDRAALYAAAFGGSSDLAQHEFKAADVAGEAAIKWDWLAGIHPKSRDSLIRKGDLPASMFGF